MKRTLHLTREALTELTTAELADVNGAAGPEAISRPHPVCAVTDITKNTTCLNCEG